MTSEKTFEALGHLREALCFCPKMDLARQYHCSAFTEYYGPSTSGASFGSQDLTSRTAYAPYSASDDTVRPQFVLNAPSFPGQAPKALGLETMQATNPWTGMPATWDFKPGAFPVGTRITGTMATAGSHGHRRKRKTTPQQRVAANIRERRRMSSLNTAFDRLRRRVPAFPHEKRLSRIQTLNLSMKYIAFMTELLTGQDMTTLMRQHSEESQKLAAAVYPGYDGICVNGLPQLPAYPQQGVM